MKILMEYCSSELIIKKSKFLSELFTVNTQETARILLKEQKEKYYNATHVVHALVIGKNAEVLGCSDDGEPPGTAGRPVMEILKNSGLTNVMATITRWFGGTLLGTGGLVKAYSESIKDVLQKAKTEELIEEINFILQCSYKDFEAIKRKSNDFNIKQTEYLFSEKVKLTGTLPAEEISSFSRFITEITKGAATIRF